jgi:hypothetical protein
VDDDRRSYLKSLWALMSRCDMDSDWASEVYGVSFGVHVMPKKAVQSESAEELGADICRLMRARRKPIAMGASPAASDRAWGIANRKAKVITTSQAYFYRDWI